MAKMTRRALSLILSLAMVLTMLPMVAMAETTGEEPEETYYCGLEEHEHTEECYGWCESEAPVCGKEEHTHFENYEDDLYWECGWRLLVDGNGNPIDEDGNLIDDPYDFSKLVWVLDCPKEEHEHTEDCYKTWDLICGQKEHTHTEFCSLSQEESAFVLAYQDIAAKYPLTYDEYNETKDDIEAAKALHNAIPEEKQGAYADQIAMLEDPLITILIKIVYHEDGLQYSKPIKTVSDNREIKLSELATEWVTIEPDLDCGQYFMTAVQKNGPYDEYTVFPGGIDPNAGYIVSDPTLNNGVRYVEPHQEYFNHGQWGIRQPFGKPVGITFPATGLVEWNVTCHVGTGAVQGPIYYFTEDTVGIEDPWQYQGKNYDCVASELKGWPAESKVLISAPEEIGDDYILRGADIYVRCNYCESPMRELMEMNEFTVDSEARTFSTDSIWFMDAHFYRDFRLYFDLKRPVTFVSNYEDGPADITDIYFTGDTVDMSQKFTRDDYTFLGWSTAPEGTADEALDIDWTMPGGEKKEYIYYAQWEKNAVDMGRVNVHYVEDGAVDHVLREQAHKEGESGTAYDVTDLTEIFTIPADGGVYERVRVEGDLSGTYPVNTALDVYVYYKFIPDVGFVNVYYKDLETGKQLLPPVSFEGKSGVPYDVTEQTEIRTIRVDGEKYVRDSVEGPVVGVYPSDNGVINVIVYYEIPDPYIPPRPRPDPKPEPEPEPEPEIDIPDEEIPLGLNKIDHYAYIIGYPDDMVHPEANITRAEVATIFFRLYWDYRRDELWSTENPYPDVQPENWFNNAVSTTTNGGIIVGYPDGTFKPNRNITRAEFAAIAARFIGDDYNYENAVQFSDISGHWAEEYIAHAASVGWIEGYPDGTFKPDQPITRAETMTLVNRMLKRAPHKDYLLPDMIHWPDNLDTDRWFYEAVQEATNSHNYELMPVHEIWTALLPNRDWEALEKIWSESHDAPGGQVVDDFDLAG